MFKVNASACGRILVALMKYIQAHKKKLLGVTISNTLILISLSVDTIYLSLQNRILFYSSYILPHLDYCCIIWGSCISVQEDKLIKFRKEQQE